MPEDDENIRQLVKNCAGGLRLRGFYLYSLLKVSAPLREKNAGRLLFDIMAPDMDGVTAVKKLRQNPAYQELPIMMLTAKTARTG